MAIPSIAATPFPIFAPPVEIPQVRGVLVQETERSLLVSATRFPLVDTVDVSDTSRLLSSMAELAQAANAAEAGSPVDSQSLIEDAQRFVDSVNALNLGEQFEAGGLFDQEPVVSTPDSPPDSLGIGFVPIDDDGSAFLLTLDTETLEGALASDPAAATGQLADFALPLGTEVAVQSLQEDLLPSLPAENTGLIATLAGSVTTETVIAVGATDTVVPDLVEVNANLRRALADTALTDTLTDILAAIPDPLIPSLLVPPALTVESEIAARQLNVESQQIARTDTAEIPLRPPIQQAATTNPNIQIDQAPLVVPAPVAEPPLSVLTPDDLLSTPLEQISRLAANPALAGAVAAFQAQQDESGRNAKVTLQSDFDVVNPMDAVLQTEAIGPNLANTSEQRRERPMGNQISEWLATRPGLI